MYPASTNWKTIEKRVGRAITCREDYVHHHCRRCTAPHEARISGQSWHCVTPVVPCLRSPAPGGMTCCADGALASILLLILVSWVMKEPIRLPGLISEGTSPILKTYACEYFANGLLPCPHKTLVPHVFAGSILNNIFSSFIDSCAYRFFHRCFRITTQ